MSNFLNFADNVLGPIFLDVSTLRRFFSKYKAGTQHRNLLNNFLTVTIPACLLFLSMPARLNFIDARVELIIYLRPRFSKLQNTLNFQKITRPLLTNSTSNCILIGLLHIQ